MSPLSAGIISLFVGMLSLFIRLFCFMNPENVNKLNINRVKLNSFSLIFLSIISLVAGISLLLIFRNSYLDPLNIIYSDFVKLRIFLGLLLTFLGIVYLYYKERIFKDWEKNGIRVPSDKSKYKKHIIAIGLILFLSGILILLL